MTVEFSVNSLVRFVGLITLMKIRIGLCHSNKSCQLIKTSVFL